MMVSSNTYSSRGAMQNPRVVSELQLHGKKLRELTQRLSERATILALVRCNLPPKLAPRVHTAGLENGRLTLGVNGAAWASRLRYVTADLRRAVGNSVGVEIVSVRIRVLPPAATRR